MNDNDRQIFIDRMRNEIEMGTLNEAFEILKDVDIIEDVDFFTGSHRLPRISSTFKLLNTISNFKQLEESKKMRKSQTTQFRVVLILNILLLIANIAVLLITTS